MCRVTLSHSYTPCARPHAIFRDRRGPLRPLAGPAGAAPRGREVLEQLVPSYLKESAAGLGEGCARAASTRNDSLLSCSAPRCAPWWPGSPPAAPGRAHLLHRHGRRPGTSRAVTAARPPRVGPDSRGPGVTPHRSGDRGMRYMGGGRGVLGHLAGATGA